jgi:hypothetical protein
MGGKATRDRLGLEHYARIGHIGGQQRKHRAPAVEQQTTP